MKQLQETYKATVNMTYPAPPLQATDRCVIL